MASSTENPNPPSTAAGAAGAPKPAAAKSTRAVPARPRAAAATTAAKKTVPAAKTTAAKKTTTTRTAPVRSAAKPKEQEPKVPETKTRETKAQDSKTQNSKTQEKKAQNPKAQDKKADSANGSGGRTVTVTIPTTVGEVVSAYVTISKLPTTLVRRAAATGRGLPVYLTLGGLAVVGIAEWPAAAAAGVGFAVLRRWGPLRPEPARDGAAAEAKKSSAPEAEHVTIDEVEEVEEVEVVEEVPATAS